MTINFDRNFNYFINWKKEFDFIWSYVQHKSFKWYNYSIFLAEWCIFLAHFNPLSGKGNTLLILRNHQNIQMVFFLKFSPIFVIKWKEGKHNKKFLVWISKTGGGEIISHHLIKGYAVMFPIFYFSSFLFDFTKFSIWAFLNFDFFYWHFCCHFKSTLF